MEGVIRPYEALNGFLGPRSPIRPYEALYRPTKAMKGLIRPQGFASRPCKALQKPVAWPGRPLDAN